METFDTILLHKKDKVATITINREAKMNALNAVTMQELSEVFNMIEMDEHISGVILTGAGDKAFVAGADIKEFVGLDRESGKKVAEFGHYHVMDRIQNFSKPVIAAVNGFALGGGLELAMSCHIRIASNQAKFGLPEVSLGLIPGYGGTQRLPQLVGRGKALEMILTGDMIDAEDALQWGLVNHVVESSELIEACKNLLDKIFVRSPTAVSYAIQAIQVGLQDPVRGALEEIELFGESFDTAESKEGIQAFLERRKPNF